MMQQQVAALACAKLGWAVFPVYRSVSNGVCSCPGAENCKNIAKHPRTPHGFKDASAEETKIREWWNKWPDANVGIATGVVSGFFVIDVDPRNDGDISLLELESQHGKLPDTVESITGGGGQHLFFKYPENMSVKTKNNALGPGLDIKGDGGYIIAPPSVHETGRHYEWEASSHPEEVSIADAPNWVFDLLKKIPDNGKEGEAIQEDRNVTLTSLAGSMRRVGFSEPAILDAIGVENATRYQHQLDPDELMKIARSVARYDPARNPVVGGFVQPLSAVELLSRDLTSPKYLGGIFSKNGINMLSGASDAGKSLIAEDLAVSHSTGTKWLGEFDVGSGVVAYVDFEMSDVQFARRLWAQVLNRELNTHDIPIKRFSEMRFCLDSADVVEELIHYITQHKVSLCIIDPLADLLGQFDENKAGDMTQALARLIQVVRATDATVVVLDHTRKNGIYKGPMIERVRGSTAKVNKCDVVVDVSLRGLSSTVTSVRNRWGPKFEPFQFTFLEVDLDGRGDIEVVPRYSGDAPAEVRSLDLAQDLIAALLAEGSLGRQEILKAVNETRGIGQRTIDEALKNLIEAETIIKEKQGRKTHYSIAPN